jgi:hypothetical protein
MNDEDRSNLRDLHAGFALVGLLMKGNHTDQVARLAYEIADAMQDERNQHGAGIVSIKRQTKKEKANETN